MPRLLTTLLAAAAIALPATALAQTDLDDMPGVIHATATATADAAPDRVSVSAGVQTNALTAKQAMADNSELMRAVFASLDAQGIPREDVSTSYLNLNPRYDYEQRSEGQPRLVGYQASNQVTVVTRDLDKTGPMIDSLITAGVNTINGVNFTVSEPDRAQAQARAAAIAKAQAKARMMAQAAGVQLGRLLSMREGTAPGPFMYDEVVSMSRQSAMDGAAPPLAPGQREIASTVTMSYAIAD
ncbi:SIMPL domain-containing protein [uncultured Algimonas sp.]|uniref:SIMPL domain-containing protein n=1 Tax=uncultured Algimonas sp. TaxID=1547920 RepID=UPI00261A7948|nr:SIMPL domain-containing protein [uncultured Algimonas sp.]